MEGLILQPVQQACFKIEYLAKMALLSQRVSIGRGLKTIRVTQSYTNDSRLLKNRSRLLELVKLKRNTPNESR